ncbi:MAG TPA: hypothetical protein VKY74_18520 [Chloroflexia bacterium]|nr:hypothetical protein [Chloroflexia bacterium]
MAQPDSYKGLRRAATVIGKASDRAVSEILSIRDGGIKGREEAITAQLELQVTKSLLAYIKEALGTKILGGVRFQVHLFTKDEEHSVGADLAGILQLQMNGVNLVHV